MHSLLMSLGLPNVVFIGSPCVFEQGPADGNSQRGFYFFTKDRAAKERGAWAGVNADRRLVLGSLGSWLLVLIKLSNLNEVMETQR